MGAHLCCLVPCADSYTGQWRQGRKHGHGTYHWKNEECYIGEWRSNERHGKGIQKYADHSQYEGEWMNDKCHGIGTFNAPPSSSLSVNRSDNQSINQSIKQLIPTPLPSSLVSYTGNWSSGRKHGSGVAVYECGTVYNGDWLTDCWHGYGELVSKDGSSYIGSFVKGAFSGHGVCNRSGDIFTGNFTNNVMNGDGKWSKLSGEEITGKFVDGVLTGVVSIIRSDTAEIYQGEILNGKKHGFGTIIYDNGESLSCNFQNGQPADASGNVNQSIFGRYQYRDGSVYEGCLVPNDASISQSISQSILSSTANSLSTDQPGDVDQSFTQSINQSVCRYLRHGEGEFRGADDSLYQGEFNLDLRSGFGHQLYADGSEYEGDWVNDRRSGRGWHVSSDPLEPRYEGEFRDDERHGSGRLFYPIVGSTSRTTRTISLIQSNTTNNQSINSGLTVNVMGDEEEEDVFCSQFINNQPVNISSNIRVAPLRMLQARLTDLTEQLRASKELANLVDPATSCKICKKLTADCMILDCAHLAICSKCAVNKPDICPQCQLKVNRIVTVIEA